MKTLLSKAAGGPDSLVLCEVPSPVATPGRAVVSVKAVGVNFPDVLLIEDRYQYKPPRPFAPGGEIAGIVKSVGAGITHITPGDRVLGNAGWGGMAEEVVLEGAQLTKIPDNMPFDDAAAFLMAYGTSYHALKDRAHLQPGQTLLVLGAAGGVGLAAVELGKHMGARVIAAASSQEKIDLCKAHGADQGLIYGRGPFDRNGQKALAELFKSATAPNGADVIYDAIGGDYAEPALRSIAWGGRYLVVGFAAGDIPKIPLNLTLLKGCSVVGVFWGAWVSKNPGQHQSNIAELLNIYSAGKLEPYISARFPLARGGEAIEHLASRQAMGKVIVTVES